MLHPTFANGGLLATATPVPRNSLAHLEGMFKVRSGRTFGTDAVAIHATQDTLSIFAASNSSYAIMRAGCLDQGTRLVLEGTWRYPAATNTGLIRLTVGPDSLVNAVCSGDFSKLPNPAPQPTFDGATGNNAAEPTSTMGLDYDHALKNTQNKFVVVAHHGACATADDCGASENSLESIRMVESFGASVVELDVHLTKDGIPIIFHDDNFGDRLNVGPLCHGPVDQFALVNIRADCTLKYGEQVPRLEEAFQTIIDQTELRGVWLDVKLTTAIEPVVRLADQYTALAAKKKRRVNFVVGLTDSDAIATYESLVPPPSSRALCLVESSPTDVRATNCGIWGPDWTLGPSAADVTSLQSQGRSVVFWTMNEQQFIDLYLTTTTPNGIVTDRPGLVFHRFQTLGTLPADRTQL